MPEQPAVPEVVDLAAQVGELRRRRVGRLSKTLMIPLLLATNTRPSGAKRTTVGLPSPLQTVLSVKPGRQHRDLRLRTAQPNGGDLSGGRGDSETRAVCGQRRDALERPVAARALLHLRSESRTFNAQVFSFNYRTNASDSGAAGRFVPDALQPHRGRRRRHRRSRSATSSSTCLRRTARDALGEGGVAAAEQRGVHEQREQLVERDALLVAGREREALLVGGEEVPARASRTAAASRGRPRGARRRRRGRSATRGRRGPRGRCRSTGRRAAARAARAGRRARRCGRRRARPPGCRSGSARRAAAAGAAAARRRTWASRARRRSGSGERPRRERRRAARRRAPKSSAPAAWICGQARAERGAVAAAALVDPVEHEHGVAPRRAPRARAARPARRASAGRRPRPRTRPARRRRGS